MEELRQLTELWEVLMRMHAPMHPAFALAPHALRQARTSLAGRLRAPYTRVFVYEKGETLQGMLIAQFDGSDTFHQLNRRGYIAETIVLPAHRGSGIGTRLVQTACAWLFALGADYIELQVAPNNPLALDFWQAQGFDPLTLHLARLRPDKVRPDREKGKKEPR